MKTIGIYDHNTGEQTTREMTVEELAEYELGVNSRTERKATELALKNQKLDILTTLGLTEDQAKILGLLENEIAIKNGD
jgi:hypothetical protein